MENKVLKMGLFTHAYKVGATFTVIYRIKIREGPLNINLIFFSAHSDTFLNITVQTEACIYSWLRGIKHPVNFTAKLRGHEEVIKISQDIFI